MSITRRQLLATMAASTALAVPGIARAADKVRIGLPTKTYWPTTDRGDRGAAKTVREGRHRRRAHDLSRRRRDFRGAGGGRRRPHSRCAVAAGRGPQEGRDVESSWPTAAMGNYGWQLMVLDQVDARRQGSQRQEGRHHLGGLGLGPAGAVDHSGKEDRLYPRARRRRRPGAQPARRQCRRRRGVFAAELPDRQIRRGAHHHRLRQGGAAEPHRRLDRARQVSRRKNRRWCRRR